MGKQKIKETIYIDFIKAANELILEQGINHISLRKISKKAGYNTATLYNYFENIDHLLFMASMPFLKKYIQDVEKYILSAKNAMDRFYIIWECFCCHAFKNPEIYSILFFPNSKVDYSKEMTHYYQLFPYELKGIQGPTLEMFQKTTLHERGLEIIKKCAEEGYIKNHDATELNDITILLFEALLHRVIINSMPAATAKKRTMLHIKNLVQHILIKEYTLDDHLISSIECSSNCSKIL